MRGANSFNHSSKTKKIKEENSEPLHGILVCVSGFSTTENLVLKSKIEKLGGNFNDNLLASTHYLIINKINSEKAVTAIKFNIKLVTKEWLDETKTDKYLDEEKSRPGCFYGLNIFLFGFNEEEIKTMEKEIKIKNGEIINNVDEADVIIVNSNCMFIDEEINKLKKYHHKTVTEKWYIGCIAKNEFKKIDEKEDSLNLELINKYYQNLIDNIKSGQNTKYLNLFLGKIFSIQGFKKQIKSKLIQIISFCNGFFFENILENTNYVIVPLTFDNINSIQNKTNIFNICPNIVTCNWIFDTIKKGSLLPTDLYKPIKSIDLPKNRINNQKILILGDIFKGESFSICKQTYPEEKINEIKEKIVQNMGEYFDAGNSKELTDFKAKFIILNDGFPVLWDKFINDNSMKNLRKLIISHRFIEECIRFRKLIVFTDFFDCVPYPFSVPLKEFQNRCFYLPPAEFSLQERFSFENLIETFGGTVDDLNPKTTHILTKKQQISQRSMDKIVKESNENVKIIIEEYFQDYILSCGRCDIDKYIVKIKSK